MADFFATPVTEVTPDSLAVRRKLAMQLLGQGSDTTPVRAWSQGAARLVQGLMGGLDLAQTDRDQLSARDASVGDFSRGIPGVSPVAQSLAGESPSPNGPKMAQVAGTEDTIPLPQRNPLGALNPEFRSKFADLRTAAGEKGAYFDAPEQGSLGNVRSPQQQLALYAQGRTAPGPIVTGTTNSNHITGRALDVVPTNGSNEKQIGSVVSALVANDPRFAGMRSGATFSNLNDPLHVELNRPTGNQVASLDPTAGVTPQPQQPSPVAQALAGPQMAQAAPQGQPQQAINPALIRALSNPFLPPALVQAGVAQLNRQLTPPELKTFKNLMGEDVPFTWDPNTQQLKPLSAAGTNSLAGVPSNASNEELAAAVDKQYPGAAARAEQLYNGEGAMPNARTNKIDGPAMQLLLKIHPDWDMSVWKKKADTEADFGTKGKSGVAIQNLAKIANHSKDLVEGMAALKNGQYPALNWVGNTVDQAMGKEAPTNFHINVTAVADEMASLMRREGMSDASIDSWKKAFNRDASEEQQKGAMRTVARLIEDRMTPLAEEYTRVKGRNIDLWASHPESKKAFDAIKQWANSPVGSQSNIAAKPAQAPPSGQLKPGTYNWTPQGLVPQ